MEEIEEPRSNAEEKLGAEFWTQPDGVLEAQFNLIYANVVGVLREEVRSRNGVAIDYLIVERMAFQYAYIRFREASMDENQFSDRSRREMNKDWIDLATAMRKMWSTEEREDTADKILKKVDKAVWDALAGLPETQGKAFMERLADSFERNKL